MPNLFDAKNSDAENHGQARSLVDAAIKARREGDDEKADLLMGQARKTDPQAVEDVLMEIGPNELAPDEASEAAGMASDEEVARISRQMDPTVTPPRVGITGSGSGADGEDE